MPAERLVTGQIYFQDQQNRKAVRSEVTETNEQRARLPPASCLQQEHREALI
jgi:hypothetical protein